MAGDDRAVVRLGPLTWRISTAVYSTIVALAALAVWEEPAEQLDLATIGRVLLVVAGPVAALAAAHTFADLAHEQVALGRAPRWPEIRHLVAANVQYLYIVIPAAILLFGSSSLFDDTDDAVGVLSLAGAFSLFVWGGVVAVMSRARGWMRIVLTLGYGTVGFGIVLAEAALSGH